MINTKKKVDTGITLGILTIWMVIVVFAGITWYSPNWLKELSNPGLNIEAISKKNAADHFLNNKKYTSSIPLYKSAIELIPDYHAAIANLAIAYQKSGQYKNAVISFKYLLNHNPDAPDIVYFNLAEIAKKTGNYTQSLNYYKQAAKRAPFPQNALNQAAKILMDQEEYEEAIAYFNKAKEARMTLKNAYNGMIAREKQLSSELDTTLLHLPADYKNIFDNSSFVYLLDHDIDLAKTYNNLGVCYVKLGRYKKSLPLFHQAIDIIPNFKEATNNIRFVKNRISDIP